MYFQRCKKCTTVKVSTCTVVQEDYSRPQPTPTLDYLHRRRQEIMAQLEDGKQVTPPPFAPSPTLPHHYESNYTQEVRGNSQLVSVVIFSGSPRCCHCS